MILEHALLEIIPGQEADFEAAFAEARQVVAGSPGFVSIALQRGIEHPSRYLLLVEWETIEAHLEVFRGSEAFKEWRRLLQHFWVDLPLVEHFELADQA